MVQIRQTPKVDDGSKGFLGDVGAIAKLAAVIPGPQQPFLAGAGALNDLTAKQGSVEQPNQIGGGGQSDAMKRRIQELMQPSQLQPPPMMGNPMQRRLGY